MSDISTLLQPDKGQPAIALHLVDKAGFDAWAAARAERDRVAMLGQGFKGEPFQVAILPGDKGGDWSAVLGVAKPDSLGIWCLARAAEILPHGSYRIDGGSPGAAALGWLLGHYRFDAYKSDAKPKVARVLLTDAPGAIDDIVAQAEATMLVRDLVNRPAGDFGPAELEADARRLAKAHGAEVEIVAGRDLETGYPMIHAVGAAATRDRAPRLIELVWGDPKHPRVAIVGKGVVFDSGGLDIKPAAGMRLMKKDMGGAAHALALAGLVMGRRLPVRLHLLIPAVENAISAAAFRPGDILKSRKGLTVEIGNTDAEGRLILADALTKAVEAEPELILDFATLTGAARVALGPDLPALFANDDALADALLAAGRDSSDEMWRMPLWGAYDEFLASDVADLNNAAETPFAGAVTASLFLQRFVPATIPWAHLDTFGWRPAPKPGRPRGGEAYGLRAAWAMLKVRYRS